MFKISICHRILASLLVPCQLQNDIMSKSNNMKITAINSEFKDWKFRVLLRTLLDRSKIFNPRIVLSSRSIWWKNKVISGLCFNILRWHADPQHTFALLVLIIARIITKYCIWFWFLLKLFKVFVFLKIKTLVLFPTFCSSPLMTFLPKVEHFLKFCF